MIIAPSLKIDSKTICIIKFSTHRTPPNHKTFLKLSKSRYDSSREERVYLLLVTFLSQGRNEIPLQISPCPPSGILFSGIFICFPWLGIGFHSTCFLTGASARNPRDIWQKAVFCPKIPIKISIFASRKLKLKFQSGRTLGDIFYKKRHFASQKAKETLLFASWNNEEDSVTRSSRDNIAPIFNHSS